MTGSPEPKKETVRIIVSPARKPLAVVATPTPVTAHPPKKETVPIAGLPHAPAKTAVEITQTQSLIDLPAVEMSFSKMTTAPLSSHPAPQMQSDHIPPALYWALLATSAAILILQIWNYLS